MHVWDCLKYWCQVKELADYPAGEEIKEQLYCAQAGMEGYPTMGNVLEN